MTVDRESRAIHEAFRRGDLHALRAALGHPEGFPNSPLPRSVGEWPLEYAIYHSPLPFIRTLLENGADPEYAHLDGFPSLIAALSSGREDRYEIIELLLDHGADMQQRGVNDYTPLHYAAASDDAKAVELLLSRGASATARTRIDECATPLEEARCLGRTNAVRVLRESRVEE